MPNRFQSIQSGMGLLKNNYGPNDSAAGEQLNALQKRGQDMAMKVKNMSLNPSLDAQQTMPQTSKIPTTFPVPQIPRARR